MPKKLVHLFLLTILLSCGQHTSDKSEVQNILKHESTDTISWIKNPEYNSTIVKSESSKNVDSSKVINNCHYDNEVSSLGIGLILPPDVFDIFDDSLLKKKFTTIDLYQGNDSQISICSKFFKPDYGIMFFVCIRETNTSYEILVNYSDIKYLPKTNEYTFKRWKEYILESYGIRRLTNQNGSIAENRPLLKQPTDQADILVIPEGFEMFCPMEIRGDWIKVTYDCFYNVNESREEEETCHEYIAECKNPLIGWLRWRQKNQLLIDIILGPC
jgi:hypothetical protein